MKNIILPEIITMVKITMGQFIILTNALKVKAKVNTRVSNRNLLHENRATIAQYISSKNCTKFRYNNSLMPISYFAQIVNKILVFVHFLTPVISLFRAISLFWTCSLSLEKKFQGKKWIQNESDQRNQSPTFLRFALMRTFLRFYNTI